MKPFLHHRRSAVILVALGVALSGCSSLNKVPVVGSFVPDLTNPAELRDAAEIAGALVLENNPSHIADVEEAVSRAERALASEVITRADFDTWVNGLLQRNVRSAFARAFIRQRFEKAWTENHHLLDLSGLVLKNPKHRELAVAFIEGLRSAVDDFKAAQAAGSSAALTEAIDTALAHDGSAPATALLAERRAALAAGDS